MSTTIDEKVVEMRFDNRDFEKNVKTSMNTLNGLKKSLDFDESTKSFSKLERASKKVKFDGLNNAIETVKVKFSYLQMAAARVFTNIVDDAYYAGKRLVKSLSIDQISAGWDKYAQKTSSVQTIMAATAKDFEDTGEQMEFVNEQLEKLNWFTDETSYNFLDMVNNIGKFTSNNVKLQDAVTAMQGISNWAAISGANVGEASRAMYNLSQSMAMGHVMLMDWRSIENANMATYEFKQQVVESAVALGTVKKKADDVYQVGKNTYTLLELFSQGLNEKWFTSDVLINVLGNYGEFTNKLYEASQEMDLTATEMLQAIDEYKEGSLDLNSFSKETGVNITTLSKYMEELSADTYELGRKAFKAAQEAKTFQEAIDSVKDAVSTGWMNTFEYIFGDYQTAKKVWTTVANELYDVFAESGNARNELLRLWALMGGRDQLFQGVANVWNNLKNIFASVKEGFHEIFPKATVETLLKITKGFRDLSERLMASEEELDKVRRIFKGLAAVLDIGRLLFSAVWKEVKRLFGYVKILSGGLLDGAANLGDFLVKVRDWIKENQIFEKGITKVVNGVKYLAGAFDSLIQKLTGYGIIDLIKKFGENIRYFYDEMKLIFQLLFGNNTPDQLSELIKQFRELTGMNFKDSKLFNFFLTTKRVFVGFKNLISDLIHGESFSDAVKTFFGSAFGTDTGGKIFKFFNDIGETCQKAWTKVSDAFSKFKAGFEDFSGVMKTKWAEISESWEKAKISIRKSWEKIKQTISEVTGKDLNGMTKFAQVISVLLYPIQLFFTGLGYAFKGLAIIFGDFGPTVLNFLKKFGGFVINLAKSISESFRNADFATFIDLLTSGSLALMFGKLAKSMLGLNKVKTDGVAGIFSVFSALGKDEEGNFNIIKFFTDLGKGMKKASGNIRKAVEEILMPIKDVFVAWQKDLQANVIFKIAAAIGILSASLILLSGVDEEKLMGAVGAVTALFAELIAAFRLISGSMAVKDSLGMGMIDDAKNMTTSFVQFAGLLISISVAVLLLSSALKKIATLEPKQLAIGIGGITAIFAEILGFLKILTLKPEMMTAGVEGLIRLSIGMYILTLSVKKLAKLDPVSMLQGLGGLGLMMAAIVAFVKLLQSMPKTVWMEKGGADYYSLVNMASGFLILSVAIRIMVMSVKSLGKMDPKKFEQGLYGFIGILSVIALSTKYMGELKGGNFAAISASMILFADAMILIAAAMKILGTMDIEHVSVATVGFFGALGLILVAIKSMKGSALTILQLAGSMLVFATSFAVLASSLLILGAMEPGKLLKSVAAMAFIFGALTLLSAFTEGRNALQVSGAFLAFSAALTVLTPALAALSLIDSMKLAGVVIALASLMTILGVLATTFRNVMLPMLALAGSIALLGVGVLALGAGFLELAAGLTALGGSLPVFVEFLRIFTTSLIEFIPNVIIAFFKSLLVSIINFGKVILLAVIDTLNAVLPPFIELLFNFLDKLLEAVKQHLPKIVANIIDIVLDLIDLLGKYSLKIVERLLNFVLDLVDSLGKAFRRVSGRIIPVIAGFIKNILVGALNMVAPWLVKLLGIEVEEIAEDVVDVMDVLSDEEKELKESIEEAKKAYDEMEKSRQAHISETQSEWKYIKDLKDEYNGLVTEEGKIKTGFEQRAETIKGLLADAMHIGVDQIESMIGANGRLGDSFDNVIKKMQAQAYLEATKDAYQESIKNKESDFTSYVNAKQNVLKTESSIQGIEAGKKRAEEQLKYLREIEQTRMLTEDEIESAIQAQNMLDEADTNLKTAHARLDEFNTELKTAEETYYGHLSIMQQWEKLQSAYLSGDTKAMSEAVDNVIGNLKTNGTATTAMLEAQVNDWKEKRDRLRELSAQGFDISEEQINLAESMYSKAMGELVKNQQGYTETWQSTAKYAASSAAEGTKEASGELEDAVEFDVNAMLEKYNILPEGMHGINLETIDVTKIDMEELEKICQTGGSENALSYLNGFTKEVDNGTGKVEKATETTIEKAANKVSGKVWVNGRWIANQYLAGFLKGLQESQAEVDEYALSSATHFMEIYSKDVFDEHSPSHAMEKIGRFFIQGLVVGMRSMQGFADSTSEDIATGTIDTMSETLMRVSDIFGSDLDVDPTIRPVIDLSNVTEGVNAINGAFGSSRTMSITGRINRDTDKALSQRIQNGVSVNNSDVVGELGKLRGDINTLNDNVGRMQVVMDTGALVGQIARPINRTLGRQAMYKGRGI